MVVALTPALIIMMIASVAMFIYTIGYDGEYVKRGRFILFFFVTAVVLIARLSMDHGKEYAGLFAIPLILVMLFATKFSLLAMLGVGLVWWIAHQLTWNCTYIENAEVTKFNRRKKKVEDSPIGGEGKSTVRTPNILPASQCSTLPSSHYLVLDSDSGS